jgi:tetratricopeptide (TPR) repeat protein
VFVQWGIALATACLALAAPAAAQVRVSSVACQVDNDSDPAAVVAVCDAALAAPAGETRFDLVVARGYARIRQQRYAEALDDFDIALGLKGQSAFVRHERAYALNGLGRYEAALAELAAEEKLLPDNPRVAQEQAFAYARLGELPEARRAWDRVVALAPGDHRARLGRAGAAMWTGDFAQARADLAMVEPDPDPVVTASQQVLARRLALMSVRSAADDPLAACRTAAPGVTGVIGDCTAAFLSQTSATARAEALGLRAAAWTNERDFGQALEDSEIAVALSPADGAAQSALGFRLLLADRSNDALARFNEAVRLDPSALTLAGRARTRFELGDDAGAAADARASIDQQPNDLAFIVLGDQAYRRSDAAAARVAWLRAYGLGYRGADLTERLARAGVTDPAKDAAALR